MNGRVGIVIIGRNEGDALPRTLRALRDAPGPMVYVDSASTDGSVAAARSAGIDVITLDSRTPLSAARGRNAGFAYLAERDADLGYVQFVDGDCMLDPTWLSRGIEELETHTDIAAVAGQVRELDDSRLLSRLLDMEWRRPAGDAPHCGGIFLVRADAFAQVGMFDQRLAAGEEPDLCRRLRAQGYRTVRIDAPMALHDGRLTRWSQWSARQQRGGRASLSVCLRTLRRGEKLYLRQVISTWVWTVGWAAMTVVCFCIDWRAGLVAAALAPLQAMRIALQGKRRSLRITDALALGALTMLGKWQQLLGQCCWVFSAAFTPRPVVQKPTLQQTS